MRACATRIKLRWFPSIKSFLWYAKSICCAENLHLFVSVYFNSTIVKPLVLDQIKQSGIPPIFQHSMEVISKLLQCFLKFLKRVFSGFTVHCSTVKPFFSQLSISRNRETRTYSIDKSKHIPNGEIVWFHCSFTKIK